MPNEIVTQELDSIDLLASDQQERAQLLEERMTFHRSCSSEFIKLLNSFKVVGPVHEQLRDTLTHAISYHKAMHVRMYLQLTTLKKAS